MSRPFVSVLTPTYNRSKFFPALVDCYKAQEYPKDRMEWIVLDDSPQSSEEMFLKLTKGIPNVRYIYMDTKVNIGAKRNMLNREAKGDICVCMDDDDYYPPERVSHAVTKLMSKPTVDLAGSSELWMFYTDSKDIIRLGPYGPNHATNGTMAYRAKYGKTHLYDETVTHAEERSFLEDYKNPMVQLDSMKVMLVMSHSQNTFNKQQFKNSESPLVKKFNPGQMKLRNFIKDPKLREFYNTL
jgi:glycosyltransferase involved in cell wall biosynthesis